MQVFKDILKLAFGNAAKRVVFMVGKSPTVLLGTQEAPIKQVIVDEALFGQVVAAIFLKKEELELVQHKQPVRGEMNIVGAGKLSVVLQFQPQKVLTLFLPPEGERLSNELWESVRPASVIQDGEPSFALDFGGASEPLAGEAVVADVPVEAPSAPGETSPADMFARATRPTAASQPQRSQPAPKPAAPVAAVTPDPASMFGQAVAPSPKVVAPVRPAFVPPAPVAAAPVGNATDPPILPAVTAAPVAPVVRPRAEMPIPVGGAKLPPGLLEHAKAFGVVVAGAQSDIERAGHQALESMALHPVSATDLQTVRGILEQLSPAVLVLDQAADAFVDIFPYVYDLDVLPRCRTFVVLVSSEQHTGNTRAAFVHSVDLIVNTSDLSRLSELVTTEFARLRESRQHLRQLLGIA